MLGLKTYTTHHHGCFILADGNPGVLFSDRQSECRQTLTHPPFLLGYLGVILPPCVWEETQAPPTHLQIRSHPNKGELKRRSRTPEFQSGRQMDPQGGPLKTQGELMSLPRVSEAPNTPRRRRKSQENQRWGCVSIKARCTHCKWTPVWASQSGDRGFQKGHNVCLSSYSSVSPPHFLSPSLSPFILPSLPPFLPCSSVCLCVCVQHTYMLAGVLAHGGQRSTSLQIIF